MMSAKPTKSKLKSPKLRTPFQDILPPLSAEEFDALKASIGKRGVLNSVLVDEAGNVLDGHHRLKIEPDAPRKVIRGLTVYAEKLPGGSNPEVKPDENTKDVRRISRGGGWGGLANHCMSAFRMPDLPGYKSSTLGFRVALTAVESFESVK
jgi:hypothetical protein